MRLPLHPTLRGPLVLALALSLCACDHDEAEPLPAARGEAAPARGELPEVEGLDPAERVVSRPGDGTRHFLGELRARDTVMVGPRSTGTIVSLPVEEGQRVAKGDLLFTLDRRHAGLSVSQARAQHKAAVVQLEQAERDVQRQRNLARRGTTSPAALEQAEAALEAAQVAAEQAKVGISMAGSGLSDRSTRAPIDGVVVELRAELGELVSMTPPTTVMVIKDLDRLELRVRVPEAALASVAPGTPIIARFPALKSERRLEVGRLGDQVDPATRTIELIAEVDNSDGTLRPGMHVEVRTADEAPLPAGEPLAAAEPSPSSATSATGALPEDTNDEAR